MSANSPRTQKDLEFKRNRDSRKCTETQKSNVPLKTGTIVEDTYPLEEIKLIEIPLKKSHLSLNVSDESFESMADKAGDTLDIKHEKVISGKEAKDKLRVLESKNNTIKLT